MEEKKTCRQTAVLRTCDCDFTGFWRPSAILTAMQEAAAAHSDQLGCGREALLQKRLAWVLSRCELHMEKYPRIGDSVTVETFPMANRRCFFPRYYQFFDGAGNRLGYAGTLWLLFKIDERKMAMPGDVAAVIPDNRDLTPPMGMPAAVEPVNGETALFQRTPSYFDLDVNQHVNNTRYADWACDALGVETLRRFCPETLCLNYDAEILPGQEITLRAEKDGLAFRVAGRHGDQLVFEVGGILKKRENEE